MPIASKAVRGRTGTVLARRSEIRFATGTTYLILQNAFKTLGCRCRTLMRGPLNHGFQSVAERLGFDLESVARQTSDCMGRNCSTAWHAIIDSQRSALKETLSTRLIPDHLTKAADNAKDCPNRSVKIENAI